MTQAAESGATILPPVPAFYGNPQTVDDLIDGTIGRILLRLGIDNELYTKWKGMKSEK
jgi:flavin prenyltransferase